MEKRKADLREIMNLMRIEDSKETLPQKETYIKEIYEEWLYRGFKITQQFQKFCQKLPEEELFHQYADYWVEQHLVREYYRIHQEGFKDDYDFYLKLGLNEELIKRIIDGFLFESQDYLYWVECRQVPINDKDIIEFKEKVLDFASSSINIHNNNDTLKIPNEWSQICGYLGSSDNIDKKEKEWISKDSKDKYIFYHTTDFHSGCNILKNEVDLGWSNIKQDFSSGNGFYLNPDFEHAKKFKSNFEYKMILVFTIDRKDYEILSQDACIYNNQFSELEEFPSWKDCIQAHRLAIPKEMDKWENISFIRGPSWLNIEEDLNGNLTANGDQLCVKCEECLEFFKIARYYIIFEKNPICSVEIHYKKVVSQETLILQFLNEKFHILKEKKIMIVKIIPRELIITAILTLML